jgi:hypothetical protein
MNPKYINYNNQLYIQVKELALMLNQYPNEPAKYFGKSFENSENNILEQLKREEFKEDFKEIVDEKA